MRGLNPGGGGKGSEAKGCKGRRDTPREDRRESETNKKRLRVSPPKVRRLFKAASGVVAGGTLRPAACPSDQPYRAADLLRPPVWRLSLRPTSHL